MFSRLLRCALRKKHRAYATTAAEYPFSNVVNVQAEPPVPVNSALRKGKGLMLHLANTLVLPEKRHMMDVLLSRRHPDRLLPGSIITVGLNQPPYTFSGVLIATRRRGLETSFVLRNIVQRIGVEMQFFVNSPDLKSIEVVQRAGGKSGKEGRRARRAKLFYLRDSPDKMTSISAGLRR